MACSSSSTTASSSSQLPSLSREYHPKSFFVDSLVSSPHRVPTLVQLCQRVAAVYVDSIYSLGDSLSYELVKPILERCTVDQLLRFEQTSPHLSKDTNEIWQDLCFRKYPAFMDQYITTTDTEELIIWKDRYFALQEAEARRLEEVGSRLRSQRMEADERKKEREVKLTDRLPTPKRPRSHGWGTTTPPKSLFQKTRTEASKLQKTMYNARILPPMPVSKGYRILPKSPGATLPFLPSSNSLGRVTVNTVVRRLSSAPSSTSPSSTERPKPPYLASANSNSSALPQASELSNRSQLAARPSDYKQIPTKPPSSAPLPDSRPLKSPKSIKKDPMASLFVPKHKAYSQRPV